MTPPSTSLLHHRVVASDAPADKDNWFVMINVPYDRGQDWARVVSKARE
ncbi:MAG: hypothetical protein MZV63_35655 [Marinilabiliales bacterium]|nr:hypothetical protein [Marinilabiliales bacterium]